MTTSYQCPFYQDKLCTVGDPEACPFYDRENLKCAMPDIEKLFLEHTRSQRNSRSFIRRVESAALPLLILVGGLAIGYSLAMSQYRSHLENLQQLQTQRFDAVARAYQLAADENNKRVADLQENNRDLRRKDDTVDKQLIESETLHRACELKLLQTETQKK